MYFGWVVVAGTFVAQMFVIGFFTYSVSLVVPLVREEFGVSMAQVMYSLTAGTFLGMILMPVAGVLLDRYPVRWVMAAGFLLFAVGLWTVAATTSIGQFIAAFGVTMAAANAFSGSPACQTVVSRWFSASRGRALGVSATGTSVGGVAIPALVTWLLQEAGWRATLQQLALVIVVLVLPVTVLTIRGKPSDIGAVAEGSAVDAANRATGRDLGLGDIVRHPGYWYIGIPFGLLFSTYTAVLANITPYLISAGGTAEWASSLIMAVAIAGLVGKLLFGMAADKLDLKLALWSAMALVLLGFLLMASEPRYPLILLSAVLLGLATGGMLPVWGAMMARVFGLASYGRAMGLMGPLITLLVMPGFVAIGRLYDATGSYRLALLLFGGVVVVGALILAPLKLGQSEEKAAG